MNDRASFEAKFLGNWSSNVAVSLFAERICAEYDRRCDLVGNASGRFIFRFRKVLTPRQIEQAVIGEAYAEAVSLGFDGTVQGWRSFVFDSRREEMSAE